MTLMTNLMWFILIFILGLGAVSYTHLDVYKRQRWDSTVPS